MQREPIGTNAGAPAALTSARLLLRPFTQDDAPEVARLCNNERLNRRVLHLPYPYTEADARAWIGLHAERIAAGRAYEFAVTDRESGALYGCAGLIGCDADNRRAEAGYWLGEPYWGRGYATEALGALLAFAFMTLDLNRTGARHFGPNPTSDRVMEKCGMRREGVLREYILKNGAFEDAVCCGILKSEWLLAQRAAQR